MAAKSYAKQGVRFNLSGFDGVEAVLIEIGKDHGDTVERRLSRVGLGAGLTTATKLIRRAAPKGSRIRKSVGSRFKKDKKAGIHQAKAGLNVGKKNGVAPHGVFFSLGTDERFTKHGIRRGRMAANRFVRRAVESGRTEIATVIVVKIKKRLPVEIERVRRRVNP